MEIVETYVGPTHEIAPPVLKVLECRMLDHLVGEVNIQGVFEQGEASVDGAVVPSKWYV